MKKRFLLSIFLITGIGIGIGLASSAFGVDDGLRAQPVAALESGAEAPARESTPLPETAIQEAGESPAATTKTDEETSGALSRAKSPAEILQELNRQATKGLTAGWIHIREEKTFDTDSNNNGVFANGVSIPNKQINDIWYHLNDDGVVIEVVYIMRDAQGQIVQVGVSSDGTAWNSATEEINPAEQFELKGLDANFLDDLLWLEKSGNQAQILDVALPDGSKGIQFVIVSEFDTPRKTSDYAKPYIRVETRALFDANSGYLLTKEVIFRFEDGCERVFSQLNQTIAFEKPSDEVLGFLAEKEASE